MLDSTYATSRVRGDVAAHLGQEDLMWVENSLRIERPLDAVFAWYAGAHAENHPRWDPDVSLERTSDEPTGVGTVFRRRNTRYGEPVEGTMEVVEYEPPRSFGVLITEGGFEMPARAEFAAEGPGATRITILVSVPDSVDADLIRARMTRSAENIRALAEADL
ncbi:SRPBCC family protein [Agromyces kandeliae]|uniref:SRPBCC family protein n=1 Tax=Agromyces kandeliae TaxID=2666141 RepID=UPI0018A1E141|nr:SRPBCC family protein [Agromyces kandeliae]